MNTKVSLGSQGSFTVTPTARWFMRRMIRFGGRGHAAGFRLVVSAGGCSGLSHEFSIEAEAPQGDSTLQLEGLVLFVPETTFALLSSVTVDFIESATQAGLTLIDPKPASCATHVETAALVHLDS